jgi:hypothetical protein
VPSRPKKTNRATPLQVMIGEIITEATTAKQQYARIAMQAKKALRLSRTLAPAAATPRRSARRLQRRRSTGDAGLRAAA